MAADTPIRSRANPALKRVAAAVSGKDRERIVLEGERLVCDAVRAGWMLELVLLAEERADRAPELEPHTDELRLVEAELLARVSSLNTAPGVLALAPRPPERELVELDAGPATLLLVVAGVSDPGNLGALARSAEAFGAAGLVRVEGGASPWNPKALRGSMGSLLRLAVAEFSAASELASALERAGYRQVRAATRGGLDLREFDWSGRVALWISGETGAALDLGVEIEAVTIPMQPTVESLNVTVAASVLLNAAHGART